MLNIIRNVCYTAVGRTMSHKCHVKYKGRAESESGGKWKPSSLKLKFYESFRNQEFRLNKWINCVKNVPQIVSVNRPCSWLAPGVC